MNWMSDVKPFFVGVFICVVCSVQCDEAEYTVEQFNRLPKEYRIGYMTYAPSFRRLGPKARVADLVEELLERSENEQDEYAKRGLALALTTVAATPHRTPLVVDRCQDLAKDLLETKFSRTAVDIYFEVLKENSRPFLIAALNHPNTTTRIQAAKRLGGYVGTLEDVKVIEGALKNEEANGNETVAEYLRKSIDSIKFRETISKGSSKTSLPDHVGVETKRDDVVAPHPTQ